MSFPAFAVGAAISANKLVVPAGYGLAVLMGTFVLTIHLPGMGDPAMQQMAMSGFLKDLALLGSALIVAGTASKKAA